MLLIPFWKHAIMAFKICQERISSIMIYYLCTYSLKFVSRMWNVIHENYILLSFDIDGRMIQHRLKLAIKTIFFKLIGNYTKIFQDCTCFSLSIHKRVIKVGDAFNIILGKSKDSDCVVIQTWTLLNFMDPCYPMVDIVQKNNTINMKKWDSKVTLYGFY